MKKKIKEFFASKINIILVVEQVLAVLFFCLSSVGAWATILFLMFEGLFFICLGIKYFLVNKKMKKDLELYAKLPINQDELESMHRKSKIKAKGNIFEALLLIFMGITLICLGLF